MKILLIFLTGLSLSLFGAEGAGFHSSRHRQWISSSTCHGGSSSNCHTPNPMLDPCVQNPSDPFPCCQKAALAKFQSGALPDLSRFYFNRSHAFTAHGYTSVTNLYPTYAPAPPPQSAFMSLDPVGHRYVISQGPFGAVYAFDNGSYATFAGPQGTVCGFINQTYSQEITEYALMTQKGTFQLSNGIVVTEYSGYALDVSQCLESISLVFYVDCLGRVWGVSADVPLAPGGFPLVVTQYLKFTSVTSQYDNNLFQLPPSCLIPDLPSWCSLVLPNGIFPLYDASVIGPPYIP